MENTSAMEGVNLLLALLLAELINSKCYCFYFRVHRSDMYVHENTRDDDFTLLEGGYVTNHYEINEVL